MHMQMHRPEGFSASRGGIMAERFENGVPADRLTGVEWRKASYSNFNGNCVEVAPLSNGEIAMRNSRFPTGPALVYTRAEMAAFLAGAKDGEFDDVLS
jgi:hypothetical protein